MHPEYYPHRYADIILNADYELKKEIEEVIRSIEFSEVEVRFNERNLGRTTEGKKQAQNWQQQRAYRLNKFRDSYKENPSLPERLC